MSLRSKALVIVLGLLMISRPGAGAQQPEEAWLDLRGDLFGEREILDGDGVVALEAPYRAADAAIVPISIIAKIPQTDARYIKTLTLVIDENPAPVAAVFSLSQNSGQATISTRVRVNSYTFVRAIAETNDGTLFMAKKFVKASGGCSAPASKNPDQALARLGKMKLKGLRQVRLGEPNQVQLLISHPNSSGLQMDQVTRHYIPAHFVHEIKVSYGGQSLMTVEGAISLSEDPSIRFSFVPQKEGEITVDVRDTEGNEFHKTWQVQPGPGA